MGELIPIQITDIPWLNLEKPSGRIVPLLPFYHKESGWSVFIKDTRVGSPRNSLVELKPGNVTEVVYFSDTTASVEDLYSHFFDFIYQRALFPKVRHEARAIFDDVLTLGASLQKLRLFYSMWHTNRISTHIVSSELEYIYMACRSIFDHLQRIIRAIWSTVNLCDSTAKRCELPESFREMIFTKDGKTHYTRDQIVAKRGLSLQMADYYLHTREFFEYLRKCRDDFTHHGKSIDTIFHFSNLGFGVSLRDDRFGKLGIWNKNNTRNDSVGSLWSLCGYIITHTIAAVEAFAITIQNHIEFPKSFAPQHVVFLRGDSLKGLMQVNDFSEKPWME